MKITFLGAAHVVTGSCYMIDTGSNKFLIDCGLFQGSKSLKELNYGEFPFAPQDIDFLILTHAHIDHCGLIPKLYKQGFKGHTITTAATAELCSIVLPDSGFIQEMEVERKNRKKQRSGLPLLKPIYTAEDAQRCLKYFQGINYNEFLQITPNITVRFQEAGHILGSAIVEIWITDQNLSTKFVFSGDLGNPGSPIINDPSKIEHADYLVLESTYGNRKHAIHKNQQQVLADIIQDTFQRGGNVIIPAFAIERTQDLLHNLNLLINEGKIKGQNIYIDSPLAISATEIFCRHQHLFEESYRKLGQIQTKRCPLYLPGLRFSRTPEESMALNKINSGAIIISASGMADAGRVKHHLKHNLWRSESSVIFVGYQAAGTLGRRLVNGEKSVRIHGEQIKVNAQIHNLEGFTAHADQNSLLNWVSHFKRPPKKIFITHGEPEASEALAKLLSDTFKTEAVAPELFDEYNLVTNFEGEPDVELKQEELHLIAQRIQTKLSNLIEEKASQQDIYHLYNLFNNIEDQINKR